MKNNTTEVVFVLDRSGSMQGLEADTIGGFNSMLEKQKKEEGNCFVTTVLFDHEMKTIHDRLPLCEVNLMTDKDYYVGGCTALLDAVGSTIEHIRNIHKYARKEDVPQNTIFVITTDGMENASHNYSAEQVKEMVEKMKRDFGWEFIFLGANIDAVSAAKDIGIDPPRAANYHADGEGTGKVFAVVSDAIFDMRFACRIDDAWADEINEDFENRKK